jgi:hypothetical protein
MASIEEKINSPADGAEKNTNAEAEVVAGGLPKSSASPRASQEIAEDAPSDAILHGFRLYAVATGLYFGALMMSLDISIIGTVIMLPCPPLTLSLKASSSLSAPLRMEDANYIRVGQHRPSHPSRPSSATHRR